MVRIIDFDWAAMDGNACYPPFINMENVDWHPDVDVGKTIKKEHDDFQLNQLYSTTNIDEGGESRRGKKRKSTERDAEETSSTKRKKNNGQQQQSW